MEKKIVKTKDKKNSKAYVPFIFLLVIVLIISGIWYTKYMKFVKTDDSLIDGDYVVVAPKIMGRISKIYVKEGDTVKSGQLLVELDSTDISAQKEQAKAMVKQAIASYKQAETKYNADLTNISIYEINADKANKDLERATHQRTFDVITEEQFENIKKNQQTALAQLTTAKAQIKVSAAQVDFAEASIANAEAQLNVISTQLNNSKLYSPFNGVVAKCWLLEGDMAQMGQSILTVNNNSTLWVSVYIEETKLKYLHLGQDVEFEIDAIPDAQFKGKITYIGNNTASKFSLIPPSNASGNFTKITQRIQMKVSIDEVDNGKVSDYNIFPGMSVVTKLIK